jgi:hypothetical protein
MNSNIIQIKVTLAYMPKSTILSHLQKTLNNMDYDDVDRSTSTTFYKKKQKIKLTKCIHTS